MGLAMQDQICTDHPMHVLSNLGNKYLQKFHHGVLSLYVYDLQ